jgi:hypothetical protein
MKPIRSLLPLLAAAGVMLAGCSTVISRPTSFVAESEEKAIAILGDDINTLSVQMLNKKVGVFYFTSVDWTASAVGKRVSGRLDDYLVKKKKLNMVSRPELERLFKKEAAEQAGMYDPEALQRQSGSLPLEAVVYGTVDNAGSSYEITVRVLEVRTGKTILLTGVRMPSTAEITTKPNPDMLALNRKSPDKVIAINKAYYVLSWMKERQPLVFLLVVLGDKELRSLEAGTTVLGEKLKVREARYKRERPEIMQKIAALKEGLALVGRYEPQRFAEITRWKKNFLSSAGR